MVEECAGVGVGVEPGGGGVVGEFGHRLLGVCAAVDEDPLALLMTDSSSTPVMLEVWVGGGRSPSSRTSPSGRRSSWSRGGPWRM